MKRVENNCFCFPRGRVFFIKLKRRLVKFIYWHLKMPTGAKNYEMAVSYRVGHMALEYEGLIIVLGGYCHEGQHQSDLEDRYWSFEFIVMYDPYTYKWKHVPTSGDIPPPNSGATGQIVGDKIYVFCGFTESENANDVYVLCLKSKVWEKLEPKGVKPFKCDKLVSWTYREKVFLFGGFGFSHNEDLLDYLGSIDGQDLARNLSFVSNMHLGYPTERGWNNQLLYFDTINNEYTWPNCEGNIPGPRAAHTALVDGHYAYIFGGRLMENRINDLYRLDLDSFSWDLLQPCSAPHMTNVPCGRSWHSLTLVEEGQSALLYGGYDSDSNPLSDCWMLNINQATDPQDLWKRCRHLEKGPILWHQGVRNSKAGQIWIIGGVLDDLLSDKVLPRHPESILKLNPSPLSLLHLAAQAVILKDEKFVLNHYDFLPVGVKDLLKSMI